MCTTAEGHYLRPIGGPWSFIRRARLMAGSTLIEDIDYYNRTHELFSNFQTTEKRINEQIEGLGNYINDSKDAYTDDPDYTYKDNYITFNDYDSLSDVIKPNPANDPGKNFKRVLFTPCFGLFTSNIKYIPLA